jgi:hypothetical protein
LLQHARRDFDKFCVDDKILAIVGSKQWDKGIQHGLVFFEDGKSVFIPFCQSQQFARLFC